MIRIGIGKDIHEFAGGRSLVLGGVEIPYDRGLLGHSDADVVSHAIADAILGAVALGDIGRHFPDTDARFRDISSIILLEKVRELIGEKGWNVGNVDCVVILQQPKIAAYIPDICRNISRALAIDVSAVSVKATTSEGLGFEGRREGATAEAVVLLNRKDRK